MAGVDPSGGAADAFTLAIVHSDGDRANRRVVQDVMRGWGRRASEAVDLEGVVREIAALCKSYRVSTVAGDRYAAGWVRERFKAEGIRYVDAELPVPQEPDAKRYLDKSLAYLEVEPLFAQGRIELLDHSQLARELKLLERRPRAAGRTLVDHPTGGHDDHANALALAVALASHVRSDPFGPWLTSVIRPQAMRRSAGSWGGGIEGVAAQLGARYDWRNL